jgi:cardiolipin synthase
MPTLIGSSAKSNGRSGGRECAPWPRQWQTAPFMSAPPAESRPPKRGNVSPAATRLALWPRTLRPGNRVTVLRGGQEAFPAMLDAIAAAQESVCLETYILEADAVGERFAEVMCERAAAGVAVRLIYDAIGCLGLPQSYLQRLRRAGVVVLEYHPILPWKERFVLSRRDHRKILVVDNEVAFTGGINLSRHYVPESQGGAGWHDVHCGVRGPVVLDLARLFRRVWVREGGMPYPAPPRPSSNRGRSETMDSGIVAQGPSLARVLSNRKYRKRWAIRRAYLHAINRAERTISLMNAYFLPDRGICWALRRAVARGVRTRVIVPETSDVPVVAYASQHLYGGLLRDGIEILCWPDRMMHAKTAVIDGTWTSIGSYNLDNVSLLYNLEVALEVLDPELGAVMDRQFESDAARCRPLSVIKWESRSITDKAISWLFYNVRHWL